MERRRGPCDDRRTEKAEDYDCGLLILGGLGRHQEECCSCFSAVYSSEPSRQFQFGTSGLELRHIGGLKAVRKFRPELSHRGGRGSARNSRTTGSELGAVLTRVLGTDAYELVVLISIMPCSLIG